MMQPPKFWFTPPSRPNLASRILRPLEHISILATKRRLARAPHICPTIPVISVGNLTLGGGGKTPMSIALAEKANAMGLKPIILSRGYGGSLQGPVQVNPQHHSYEEVGDEPLLIANFAPVIIARKRAYAAKLALTFQPDLLILDDGHQNPDIKTDHRIVVVDAKTGFGNGRVAPAGPLREPVREGLERADLLIPIGTPKDISIFKDYWQKQFPSHLKIETASLSPLPTGMPWQGLPALAFAGIARPEKFFQTLRDMGVDIKKTIPLGDHQPLSAPLIERLRSEAQKEQLRLVTTEKDAVRLPKNFLSEISVLPVRLNFSNDAAIDSIFKEAGLI